jgi:hypothetical protein
MPLSAARERRKTAQRCHVTRIPLQYLANDSLRRLAVVGHERGSCLFDTPSFRVGQPPTLEGTASVRILPEVYQHITVRKPCTMVIRYFLQYLAHLIARPRRLSAAAVGARQIHARVRKFRGAGQRPFERCDALGDLVLVQQRCTQ